jgi:3D (Asp-Asp-Asp) domain-containing protein
MVILMMKRFALLKLLLLLGLLSVGGGCATRHIQRPRRRPDAVLQMEVTGYCPCGICCGWERRWFGLGPPVYSYGPNRGQRKIVGQTASGTRARRGTVAADTSVLPFGTIVYVEGYGWGRVEDRGGAIRGNKLDLFYRSHRQALEWGRQHVPVQVWYPR